jgi:hypothetical protein
VALKVTPRWFILLSVLSQLVMKAIIFIWARHIGQMGDQPRKPLSLNRVALRWLIAGTTGLPVCRSISCPRPGEVVPAGGCWTIDSGDKALNQRGHLVSS